MSTLTEQIKNIPYEDLVANGWTVAQLRAHGRKPPPAVDLLIRGISEVVTGAIPAAAVAQPVAEAPASKPLPPLPSTVPSSVYVMTVDGKDRYEASLENLKAILNELAQRQDRNVMRYGFDEFRARDMVAPAGTENWTPLTDDHLLHLREHLARVEGFAPIGKEMMRDAIHLIAIDHRFDSAIVWLDGLVWDGVPRIERFLAVYCGTPDDEYTRAVGRYMWSGMAGRVLDPGCQLDMVIAMQSPQGLKKSTGLQLLAPWKEAFTDGLKLHHDDADFKRLLRGKLVIEIAEMAGLSKADIEDVKRVITRRTEEWIEKYQTLETRFERRCMLFASTNKEQFLPADETGHRRWLPVQIVELIREMIERDRDQLWAEGAALWRGQHPSFVGMSGVQYADAERLARGKHKSHEQTDVWQAKIEEWLAAPRQHAPAPSVTPFTTDELLREALKMTDERMDGRAEKRAAGVLRILGYERRSLRLDGRVTKRWIFAAIPPPPA